MEALLSMDHNRWFTSVSSHGCAFGRHNPKAAARFLIRKLYQCLVSERVAPPDTLLEPLCDSFRKSDYDMAALVRTILSSRHFYSEHAFRQRIKSPVEYVLGAVQQVYRRYR